MAVVTTFVTAISNCLPVGDLLIFEVVVLLLLLFIEETVYKLTVGLPGQGVVVLSQIKY